MMANNNENTRSALQTGQSPSADKSQDHGNVSMAHGRDTNESASSSINFKENVSEDRSPVEEVSEVDQHHFNAPNSLYPYGIDFDFRTYAELRAARELVKYMTTGDKVTITGRVRILPVYDTQSQEQEDTSATAPSITSDENTSSTAAVAATASVAAGPQIPVITQEGLEKGEDHQTETIRASQAHLAALNKSIVGMEALKKLNDDRDLIVDIDLNDFNPEDIGISE